jgi:hypothetical protein
MVTTYSEGDQQSGSDTGSILKVAPFKMEAGIEFGR